MTYELGPRICWGCGAYCLKDDYCVQCREYVCSECDVNALVKGERWPTGHIVEDHLAESESI
jgi:hypothetical protein